MTAERPPEGLATRGRRLWRAITAVYDLLPQDLELLLDAGRTADLIDRLTEAAREAPPVVDGRAHPLIVELRQQRDLLGRLLARLALPSEDVDQNAAAILGQRGGRARARKAH